MRAGILLSVLLFTLPMQAIAFEITGNVRAWEGDDFLGFDAVGDCAADVGDITSAFARVEGDRLFLRITFDDMALRDGVRFVRDRFAEVDVRLRVAITDSGQGSNLVSKVMPLHEHSLTAPGVSLLRTPQANLTELAFDCAPGVSIEDLSFAVEVIVAGEVVDRFSATGTRSRDSGNCAFVHHGNQGLTYSEVFYGSPAGLSGMEGSGFDEILQVHEATGVPGNFHLSGTLMVSAEWHNPEFNDWLGALGGSGVASIMTSALGQHMMPFVNHNMNEWAVHTETDMAATLYGYDPRVAWIPERVWLSPGAYPDACVIDWIGDNWTQHGVWAVLLDDSPHLAGYDNRKIHWMANAGGVDLRVVPINNDFVGNMHYDADGAKNHIASMGQYGICVYGTDWEVAAEMNEHDGGFYLDNYENVLWYCYDNYPGVNAWKLEDALMNPDFNGVTANITPGTYGMLGGGDGYGGSNNSWYCTWAATPSHSDHHDPAWTYGYIWDNVYNNLMSAPDNELSELGWYTLMINLHETGWHTSGEISDWEHRYSSHIKNAHVYAEAARWAEGLFGRAAAAEMTDIDQDGGDELLLYNGEVLFVFEGIGGKANWVFCKDANGIAHSVVGSDVAYWTETDGDFNEGSNNHVAALSDVNPLYQNELYDMTIDAASGDVVQATLTHNEVSKTVTLGTDDSYLDVMYVFGSEAGYVKSGWSPDLMSLIWTGRANLQRMWGEAGEYCGQRNAASGVTVAAVLGQGGASHNAEFEGTLVKGDEIAGAGRFLLRLFAGPTSEPYDPNGNKVAELDTLSEGIVNDMGPRIIGGEAALLPRGHRQAPSREHDRVRQDKAPRRRHPRAARLQHGDLPGHRPASGHEGGGGRPAYDRAGRPPARAPREDADPPPPLRAPALRRLQPLRQGDLRLHGRSGRERTEAA